MRTLLKKNNDAVRSCRSRFFGKILSAASLALLSAIASSPSLAGACSGASYALTDPNNRQITYPDTAVFLRVNVNGVTNPDFLDFLWSTNSDVPDTSPIATTAKPVVNTSSGGYTFSGTWSPATNVPRNTRLYFRERIYCSVDESWGYSLPSGYGLYIELKNSPPTIKLSFDQANKKYTAGTPVTIYAAVSDNRDSFSLPYIEYKNKNNSLTYRGDPSTFENGQYKWVISNLETGTWTFTVRSTDSPTDNSQPATGTASDDVQIASNLPPSVSIGSVTSGTDASVVKMPDGYRVTPASALATYQLRVVAQDMVPSGDQVTKVEFRDLANPSTVFTGSVCGADYCWTVANKPGGVYQPGRLG